MPAWTTLRLGEGQVAQVSDIGAGAAQRGRDIAALPFSLRVMFENLLRARLLDPEGAVTEADIDACLDPVAGVGRGVPLAVARVILPDSSGLPVLLDLAALRDAVREAGGDPSRVNPMVAVDLIVDHSLQVDHAGRPDAPSLNLARELERNAERYRFLKWAQQAFSHLRVFPPGTGIIHQVNLEHIAPVVMAARHGEATILYPDFVIGGDSHTPMVNAIGVLGWGVGGIDAEAALLGQPYVVPVPEVVGVRLEGSLPPGAMTTDLALLVTQRLRQAGVTGCFVEFFGPAVEALSVPERASLSNMAPEYGATVGYFPIDAAAISFIARSRGAAQAALVEAYARANHLFREAGSAPPRFKRAVGIDLAQAVPSVAGPRRPQDRLSLAVVASDFRARLPRPPAEGGFGAGADATLPHGSIVLAAIASCTNTSNPSVMLAAGLLARRAVERGLGVPEHVKTSMAPGSRLVTRYLENSRLLPALEALGFHVIGYGCTSCGGKSGPLAPPVAAAIEREGTVAVAVLSGNRNFEGRIHRLARANYIMSPPLVVAYALAGRIDIDFEAEPLGHAATGEPVFLRELWPAAAEIAALLPQAADPALFTATYGGETARIPAWEALEAPGGTCFPWDRTSLYMVEPPFFREAPAVPPEADLEGARVLALFGDSLTTDHISPSGEIPLDSPAGAYLSDHGVAQKDFNTYVGRRCNHEVMVRATFANLRVRNLLVPGREGGFTRDGETGEVGTIHAVAARYRERGTPAIVLAGREYGTGSSRDWAAKGSTLLGVRAVLAESFERIHRANLIGMGVLPLRFADGEGWRSLGLTGEERFTLRGIGAAIHDGSPVRVAAERPGWRRDFTVRLDSLTESERRILLAGGIQRAVMRHFITAPAAAGSEGVLRAS